MQFHPFRKASRGSLHYWTIYWLRCLLTLCCFHFRTLETVKTIKNNIRLQIMCLQVVDP